MKTITKKIAKNGAEIWYVDGKRVSRETAEFEERNNRRLERFAKSKIAEETAKIEEEPEMKNQNTNAVCTPATIETKIAKNGAAIVYVNGKRTSNEQAVEIAKQNGLPVYQASYLSYTDNGNSETFATALSAYKWLVSKANSNSNIADGSRTITRIAPNQTFITGTEIYDFDNNINVDDEPELATIIYAEIGEEHIKSRYNSMILFHDQLIKDGLTEEQINQVLVVEAGNKNGLAHCKLIKEFKAQNGIVEKKTVVDAGEDKENKFGITVIGHDNRRVNVRPDCKIVAIQSNLWVAGNRIGFYDTPIEAKAAEENLKAAIKNGAGEYMIDGVEVEANVEDYAVSTEAQEVATEAETELATNTATEITPIDAAIETLDDDIAEYQAKFDAAVDDSNVDFSSTLIINGEHINFVEGKLDTIIAPELDAEITFSKGKKIFRYRGTVQSKAEFFKRLDELADIKAQIAAVDEFRRKRGVYMVTKHDFARAPFVMTLHVVIKSGEQSRQLNFAGEYLTFDGAKKFIDDFKAFASEIKFTAVIKRDKTTGEECYRREFDGEETLSVDAPEPQDAEPEEYAVTAEAQDAAIEAEVEFAKLGEPETKETLRKKAAKLVDLKEGLDKEKAFAECARDKFEIAQTWMRAASKNSYSAEFYAEQIATMGAAVKKLNERIAELAAQITAVETELETVNKKITAPKKAA